MWEVEVIFLLLGHTHNKLDRFFSRVAVALAGRDYFTVSGNVKSCPEAVALLRHAI